VEEQGIILVGSGYQPSHSPYDICFGRRSSGILGIISEHDDIFGLVTVSFCESATGLD